MAAEASSAFHPAAPRQSIRIFKKKNHYNEWEFTYDPISDAQTISGGNAAGIGQPTQRHIRLRYVRVRHIRLEYLGLRYVAGPPSPNPTLLSSSSSLSGHPAHPRSLKTQKARPSGEPLSLFPIPCSVFPVFYTWNDEPHPQVDFTWGFSNLKPAASRVST